MLEKIGLPPKPSMRGASWVVDASHCQGCSSQFTFLNRKHHCRRCGGIFCNNCTQQRMTLRGQGDSPVRICDPCKKLEDAARFELRYGHKNRAAKGTSKQVHNEEEDIINQILGSDGKQEANDDLLRTASSSSSGFREEPSAGGRQADSLVHHGSSTPAELRLQAAEEKKKHRILKGHGRSEEALKAFKRGKELERQADALEIALRKNRRLASKNPNVTLVSSDQKKIDGEEVSDKKKSSQRGKEEKNDLGAELRELGWSDADLHDAEKKPANLSLESELSNLLGEISQGSSGSKKQSSIDKSQVFGLKKKALQLKREGKLAEAKEELKRAKILEKQLEEQELLGESEDSDDELSALIRSMKDEKNDDLFLDHAPIPGINLENLLGGGDDVNLDDNLFVTDNDMNDPEIAVTLKSFGWSEEDGEQDSAHLTESKPMTREALQQEVFSLKQEALKEKRGGNVAEAMSLLKKAKLLEKDLESMQLDMQPVAPETIPKNSNYQVSPEKPLDQTSTDRQVVKVPGKTKLALQRELLALKKKALALKKEGRIEEADEELKKGKALEEQLEQMENVPKRPASRAAAKKSEMDDIPLGVPGAMDLNEEGAEAEVTDQDMNDPALMSVLKNLGWNEDDTEAGDMENSKNHVPIPTMPRRNKAAIQRELLGLKRKALQLRRQGKMEEADEELEKARHLEEQLAEMEATSSSKLTAVESHSVRPLVPEAKSDAVPEAGRDSKGIDVTENKNIEPFPGRSSVSSSQTDQESTKNPGPQSVSSSHDNVISLPAVERATAEKLSPTDASSQSNSRVLAHRHGDGLNEAAPKLASPDQETAYAINAQKEKILAHKRKALALKREGKLAEAREELRQAKLLESSSEDGLQQSNAGQTSVSAISSETAPIVHESRTNQQGQKPLSSRERLKIQQESLAHKRNALKLRREGKIEESDAELELAKALESQLEDSNTQGSSTGGMDGAGVEALIDPQLMSALKSIGWSNSDFGGQPSKLPEPKPDTNRSGSSEGERTRMEEMIKAEKTRALRLKREGKQAEALEALRSAKRLEKKKLDSLT